jgi:hypothetical protein
MLRSRVNVNGVIVVMLVQFSRWLQQEEVTEGERYEKLEFQKKVEQKFKSLKDSAWQVLRLMS